MDNSPLTPSQARDIPSRRLFFAALVVIIVGAALFYLLPLRDILPVMPLDDTYIHFQYARSIADGVPFQYNPGQPATSGATSLLYPVILAAGYLVGFQAERLAWWALAIGLLSWIGSAWLVFLIGCEVPLSLFRDPKRASIQHWLAFAAAIAFALTGSLEWAFLSGMETGLMVFLTLLTLWCVIREDRRSAMIAGTLAALIRPEGVAIGGVAALYLLALDWREGGRARLIRNLPMYIAPFIFALLQPLINLLATGSVTASGMQAKSYLYNVPADLGTAISNIAHNIVQMWAEMFSGLSPIDGRYTTLALPLLTLGVIVWGVSRIIRTRRLNPTIVVLLWLIGLTLVVATLETAFWQFKRYQQPMIALLYPMIPWALIGLGRILTMDSQRSGQRRAPRYFIGWALVAGIVIALLATSVLTTRDFAANYSGNVREVAGSQMQMAKYVAATLPPDAIVGVHDIGVMRYLGNHTTYDVIGLTTPGAARAARNGPGAMAEQMLDSPYRPDYFAIYPDARGLTYFQNTGLFANKLASFPSTNPEHNVASATASGQNVYKADWTYAAFAKLPLQPSSLSAMAGMTLVDSVNVADLNSEDAHQYRWWQAAQSTGFPTELREMTYIDCKAPPDDPSCKVLDGGRLITGGEEMTIQTQPGKDLLWVTRVHPFNTATLHLFANGQPVGARVIPVEQGRWLEIDSLIPASMISGTRTTLRAEANITDPNAGHYMPYYHWFYQGTFQPNTAITLPASDATFGGTIHLAGRQLTYDAESRTVSVALQWRADGTVPLTDEKTFVHLYAADGTLVQDAQIDRRPGNDTLPPANWLPGVLDDSYTLTLPGTVSPGTYRVMIGLYDPVSGERLEVAGQGVETDRRLVLGEITVR